MTRIAGPPYRDPVSQWHGPCYVLDPEHWAHGWREVLAVIPAIQPRLRRERVYATVSRRVPTGQTRQVVTFPRGRPWDYRFVDEPIMRTEPGWYARARELRTRGLSVRSIMRELDIASYGTVYRVLYG